MPHISKKKLEEEQVNDLFLQIVYVMDRAADRGKLEQALRELLTPTEKVMLAKRLAVVSMLSQDMSVFDIAESLSMSPSTIDLMSLKHEIESYSTLVEHGLRKRDIGDVIRMIETIGGLVPPRGRGRWKNFNEGMKKAHVEERLRRLTQRKKRSRA
jgi:Trp operon repressor